MAKVQRVSGDSHGVTNVDRSRADAPDAALISTGIGKHPTAYKIVFPASAVAQMGVEGAVEAALRTVQVAATTIAYQLDAAQLSVLCEATGWTDATLQAALNAQGVVNGFDFAAGAGTVVTSTGGIKLA